MVMQIKVIVVAVVVVGLSWEKRGSPLSSLGWD